MLYEPEQGGSSDEEMLEDFMSDGARLNQQLEWRNRFSREHGASAAKTTGRLSRRGWVYSSSYGACANFRWRKCQ